MRQGCIILHTSCEVTHTLSNLINVTLSWRASDMFPPRAVYLKGPKEIPPRWDVGASAMVLPDGSRAEQMLHHVDGTVKS